MKAVVLKGFGGPEVMHVADVPMPEPQDHQVRVTVEATSVNRADIVQRQGNYPPPPGESDILGLEMTGVVDRVGSRVSGWKPGDRVMGLVAGGGYAEYALAYPGHLMRVPDTLSAAEAACISETYITAFLNLFLIAGFGKSETVLLHGGGGGVTTAAIQLCRTQAPEGVIIVTASPGKIERVADLEVDHVIDYTRGDFSAEVRSFTRGRGVDVILDHIGAEYLEKNLTSLAVGGRMVIIGVMGGAVAALNLAHLMVKRQRIIGSTLRARPVVEKTGITDAFRDRVLPLIAARRIVPLIHRVFELERIQDAHREMESGRHFGKIVLRVA
jgi:putative PIG3 family NAD(P)H quinone oxidoreductase